MINILLTGGSGFIGKNVIEYFKDKNDYKITSPTSSELNCLDYRCVKSYLTNNYFDIVLNFAVYHNRLDTTKDANLILKNNLLIYYNFANLSNLYGKMFYTGSGAEYDKRYDIKEVKESDVGINIPIDQYGLAKYIIGKDIEHSNNIYNLRLFGIYGKYEDYRTRFISNIICKALLKKQLTMRQNVYFSYLYIDDFVKLIHLFIDKNLNYKTYNMVPNNKIDLLSIFNIVKKEFNLKQDIKVFNCGLSNEYTASNNNLMKEVNNYSFVSMEDSIKYLHIYYNSIINSINSNELVS